MIRRIAANYVIIGEKRLVNHVVELHDSRVVNYYPLKGETAMTEWLGGTIEIIKGKAWHISRDGLRKLLENCPS